MTGIGIPKSHNKTGRISSSFAAARDRLFRLCAEYKLLILFALRRRVALHQAIGGAARLPLARAERSPSPLRPCPRACAASRGLGTGASAQSRSGFLGFQRLG